MTERCIVNEKTVEIVTLLTTTNTVVTRIIPIV